MEWLIPSNGTKAVTNTTLAFTPLRGFQEQPCSALFPCMSKGVNTGFGLRMSVKILSAVWSFKAKSSTEKLVLLALADNANDEGVCWPSQGTLSRKTNLQARTIRTQLSSLAKQGIIAWTMRKGHSSVYRLFLGPKVTPDRRSYPPRIVVPTEPSFEPSKDLKDDFDKELFKHAMKSLETMLPEKERKKYRRNWSIRANSDPSRVVRAFSLLADDIAIEHVRPIRSRAALLNYYYINIPTMKPFKTEGWKIRPLEELIANDSK